jgi:hypothetical protein
MSELYWYLGGLLGLVLLSLLIGYSRWKRDMKKHTDTPAVKMALEVDKAYKLSVKLSPETVREEARDSLILRYGEDKLTELKKK